MGKETPRPLRDIRLDQVEHGNRHEQGVLDQCIIPGCLDKPREKKDYCPKHIDHMPYAARLIAVLEQRDKEISFIKKHKYLPEDSFCLERVVETLKQQPFITIDRLNRYTANIPLFVVKVCVNYLHGEGRVTIGCSGRKQVTVAFHD